MAGAKAAPKTGTLVRSRVDLKVGPLRVPAGTVFRAVSREGRTYTIDGTPSSLPVTAEIDVDELDHAASVDMLIGRKVKLLADVKSCGVEFKAGEVGVVSCTVKHMVTVKIPSKNAYARRVPWAQIAPI